MMTVMHLWLYLHKSMLDKHSSLTSIVSLLLPFTASFRFPAPSRLFPILHHTNKNRCTLDTGDHPMCQGFGVCSQIHCPHVVCCLRCSSSSLSLKPLATGSWEVLDPSATLTSASITVALFQAPPPVCLSLDSVTGFQKRLHCTQKYTVHRNSDQTAGDLQRLWSLTLSNLKKDHGTGHGFWLPQWLPKGIRWCYFPWANFDQRSRKWHGTGTHILLPSAPVDSLSSLFRGLCEAEQLVVFSEVASCSVKHCFSDGGGAGVSPCSHGSFPLPLHSCISEILLPSNALALKPCLVVRSQETCELHCPGFLANVFWMVLTKCKDLTGDPRKGERRSQSILSCPVQGASQEQLWLLLVSLWPRVKMILAVGYLWGALGILFHFYNQFLILNSFYQTTWQGFFLPVWTLTNVTHSHKMFDLI